MDKRVVDFIRALRASGVRISLAESQEALHALEQVGVQDREVFRDALKATLNNNNNNNNNNNLHSYNKSHKLEVQ